VTFRISRIVDGFEPRGAAGQGPGHESPCSLGSSIQSTAAAACRVVLSNTGSGLSAASISSVISVQPRITASQPCAPGPLDGGHKAWRERLEHHAAAQFVVDHAVHLGAVVIAGHHAPAGRGAAPDGPARCRVVHREARAQQAGALHTRRRAARRRWRRRCAAAARRPRPRPGGHLVHGVGGQHQAFGAGTRAGRAPRRAEQLRRARPVAARCIAGSGAKSTLCSSSGALCRPPSARPRPG
jgi:hypothetical protein